jgi:hypothetical protein
MGFVIVIFGLLGLQPLPSLCREREVASLLSSITFCVPVLCTAANRPNLNRLRTFEKVAWWCEILPPW